MYGQWQLGNMPLEQYVKKHNSVVDAIRQIDPTAHVVAVGTVGPWDEGILAGSADHMDLISEHIYRKEQRTWTRTPGSWQTTSTGSPEPTENTARP